MQYTINQERLLKSVPLNAVSDADQ